MSTLEAYFNGKKELFNGLAMERLEKEWNVYLVLRMDFSISKFSQMSIFYELNNLQNISLRDEYSAICGITEKELRSELKTDIEIITQANEETYEEACAHLKLQYDGYHFSKRCEDIYNPFSLFNAFVGKNYENFWFSTGTPTFLIELLKQSQFDIRELDNTTELRNSSMHLPTLLLTPFPYSIKVLI